MQHTHDPAQTGEQPPAFWTHADMPLHPRPPTQGKLSVEIRRHMARRPAMIAAVTQPMPELAHVSFDPVNDRIGSRRLADGGG